MQSQLTAPQEALVRAVLPVEQARPLQEVGPVQEARQEASKEVIDLAAKIREKLAGDGSRAALEFLRDQPIDTREVDKAIDKNIGWEKNPDGTKVRNAEEQSKFDRAKEAAEIARQVVQGEYDSLTPQQQQKITEQIDGVLKKLDFVDNFLSSFPAESRKDILQALVKYPQFVAKLRSVFSDVVNPEKALKDAVSEAKSEFDEAIRQEEAKKEEESKIISQKDQNRKELEELEGKKPEIKNVEKKRLELESDLYTKNGRLKDIDNVIQGIKRKIDSPVEEGAKEKDYGKLRDQLTKALRKKERIQKEADAIQKQLNLKSELEQKRAKLEEKQEEIKRQIKDLGTNRFLTQVDFDTAKSARQEQEEKFVQRLEGIFSETTRQYLDENIRKADEELNKITEERKKSAADEEEKLFFEALRNRWEEGPIGKRGLIKGQIGKDFEILKKHGPVQLLKTILIDGGAAIDEAEAKLADRSFIEKFQPELAIRFLAKRLEMGKISEAEAEDIAKTDWGKDMLKEAQKRIEENKKEYEEQVKKLKEEGKIAEATRLKKILQSGKNLISFIAEDKKRVLIASAVLILGGGVATYALSPAFQAGFLNIINRVFGLY